MRKDKITERGKIINTNVGDGTGSRKSEDRSQEAEERSRKTEVRRQKTEIRSRESGVGSPRYTGNQTLSSVISILPEARSK